MKKIIMSLLLITVIISSAFTLVFQADGLLGSSSGFDAGVVLGEGNFKHTVGIMSDFRYITKKENTRYGSVDSPSLATYFGPFYKFSFDMTFVNLGSVGIGIDVGALASLGIDPLANANIALGLQPTIKVSFKRFDLFAGWRGLAFLVDATDSSVTSSWFKNSFVLGARFKIAAFFGHNSAGKNNEQTAGPGYDYNPTVKRIE